MIAHGGDVRQVSEQLGIPASELLDFSANINPRGLPARARARLALKGLEYLPSTRRLLRRIRELDPDVVHLEWLPRPELDVRWVRRLGRPTALTAHDVVPRRERALPAWREALGLVDRQFVRRALVDRAEAAGARADVAQDHERRGAARVALRAVGAAGVLADRLQPQLIQKFLSKKVLIAAGQVALQPGGQAACGRLGGPDDRQ